MKPSNEKRTQVFSLISVSIVEEILLWFSSVQFEHKTLEFFIQIEMLVPY